MPKSHEQLRNNTSRRIHWYNSRTPFSEFDRENKGQQSSAVSVFDKHVKAESIACYDITVENNFFLGKLYEKKLTLMSMLRKKNATKSLQK